LPGEATALRAVALSALGQDAFGSLQAANQSLKTFKDLIFFFFPFRPELMVLVVMHFPENHPPPQTPGGDRCKRVLSGTGSAVNR